MRLGAAVRASAGGPGSRVSSISLPLIRVCRSADQASSERVAGSSTSEWSGRITIAPKSPRSRPPSLAIAPTICRGSTFCRLPTAIRYVAIGPLGGAAPDEPPVAPCGARALRVADRALRLLLEQQRGVALEHHRQRRRHVDLGDVVLVDVVAHDVAEEADLRRPEGRGDLVVEPREPGVLTSSTVGSCICVSGCRVAFSICLSR